MHRANPLITPEELQCLLGNAAADQRMPSTGPWRQWSALHVGAALWLVKGLFFYAALLSPDAAALFDSGRYLGMRAALEGVCLLAFWGGALHPKGRQVTRGAMLVASTTLVMDAMIALAFSS